jgi:hypothetical protein
MMFSSKTCRFVLLSLLSLSTNAETVRGAQRKLTINDLTGLKAAIGDYAILAKNAISTVPTSAITGNIAVDSTAEAMTGFSFFLDEAAEWYSKSLQFTDTAFATNLDAPSDPDLTTSVSNMVDAYNYVEDLTTDTLNLDSGILTEVTLTKGVYTFTSGVHLTGDIYFDGSATDVFVIQMTGDLLQDASYKVTLLNGALAENIFWQVAGTVTVKAGANMKGTLLAKTSVAFLAGSSLDGRVLTQTACTLDSTTVTPP